MFLLPPWFSRVNLKLTFSPLNKIVSNITVHGFYWIIPRNKFIAVTATGLELQPFKGNAQFVQKVTFELLMDFKQNYYGN